MRKELKANDLFQMMNTMGGEDDLPDLDGADDVRTFLKKMFYTFFHQLSFTNENVSLNDFLDFMFRMSLQIVMMKVSNLICSC